MEDQQTPLSGALNGISSFSGSLSSEVSIDSIKVKGIWQKLGFTSDQLNEAKTIVASYKVHKDSKVFMNNLQALFGDKAFLFLRLIRFIYSEKKPRECPSHLEELHTSSIQTEVCDNLLNDTLKRKSESEDREHSPKRRKQDGSLSHVSEKYGSLILKETDRFDTTNQLSSSTESDSQSLSAPAEANVWPEIRALVSLDDDMPEEDLHRLPFSSKFQLVRRMHESSAFQLQQKTRKIAQLSEELKKNEGSLCQSMVNLFQLDDQIKELEKRKYHQIREIETIQSKWDLLKREKDYLGTEIRLNNLMTERITNWKTDMEHKSTEWALKLSTGMEHNIGVESIAELVELLGLESLKDTVMKYEISGKVFFQLTDKQLEEMAVPLIARKRLLYFISQIKCCRSLNFLRLGGPTDWDHRHLSLYVKEAGLEEFSQIVRSRQIPGCVIIQLKRHDLETLGVTNAEQKELILNEIDKLRSEQAIKEKEHLLKKNLELRERITKLERESNQQKERLQRELDVLNKNRQNSDAPSGFFCCITGEIMSDPVIAADGFTYERSAIQKWLVQKNTSPMTNLPLVHTFLTPNRTLLSMISEFLDTAKK
eukprot:TRINITY_DN3356_c0_g1_i1.p1 TRINITY_DN3356_c0_g1~~TRINITY_DN3356_c0_g1_i1.p1  ORF type:complete len:596 (-),score=114.80 TRINITY_DN3356_c0_g1_i1:481-2268(-)